jgi:hypothetical protein
MSYDPTSYVSTPSREKREQSIGGGQEQETEFRFSSSQSLSMEMEAEGTRADKGRSETVRIVMRVTDSLQSFYISIESAGGSKGQYEVSIDEDPAHWVVVTGDEIQVSE